jgi:TRAP-type C4-dicarboxylate transport system permease large subunit
MGLAMVMCNQIGAVSPPTAPLLFVTTSIAQTTFRETNRHVWWFMLAEVLVLLLVIFIPGLVLDPPVLPGLIRQRVGNFAANGYACALSRCPALA